MTYMNDGHLVLRWFFGPGPLGGKDVVLCCMSGCTLTTGDPENINILETMSATEDPPWPRGPLHGADPVETSN